MIGRIILDKFYKQFISFRKILRRRVPNPDYWKDLKIIHTPRIYIIPIIHLNEDIEKTQDFKYKKVIKQEWSLL